MAKTSLQAVYEQAQRFLEENDTERAIAVVNHILNYFPDNLEAHRLLGEAYLINRQFDKAEDAFRRVLNADPENIPAHVGIGITYERQSRLDRAVSEFEQALEIKPDMTELRSQLLRLYTEAWGSEHAQLRLSRPGLARLYAKGHMLTQAIQEFRSVVADHPERFDARVGLVEALWRCGQEEMATAICDEILAERHDVLKANLFLGYIKLSAGDPSGEKYWRAAQQLDPYHNVARVLFGQLPGDTPTIDLTLPEWDDAAWKKHREQEKKPVQPSLEKGVTVTDQSYPSLSVSHKGSSSRPLSDDELLASLLGFGDVDGFDFGQKVETAQFAGDYKAKTSTFTFGSDEHFLSQKSEADSDTSVAKPSLNEDVGFEDLDVAPFSLGNLGLSEEEIASLNDVSIKTSSEKAVEIPMKETEERIRQESETVSFIPPEIPEYLPKVEQTSNLSDVESFDWSFGIDVSSTEDTYRAERVEEKRDDFSDLEPFEMSSFTSESMPMDEEEEMVELPDLEPFDWSSEDVKKSSSFEEDKSASEDDDILGNLQPFSLDDLDLSSDEDLDELPPSLQPFSVDESERSHSSPKIQIPRVSEPTSSVQGEETVHDGGAYSWQTPSSRTKTDFLRGSQKIEPTEGSIFSRLKQRRQEISIEEPPPLPEMSLEEEDSLKFFSDDNVSLRDENETEPKVKPLSLQELGLSDDEITSLGFEKQDDIKTDEDETGPRVKPLLLQELGLSDDDIVSLGFEKDEAEVMPFAEFAPTMTKDEAEPEIKPLSLQELGLSDDDIALLGFEKDEAEVMPFAEFAPTMTKDEAEPEIKPLSLQELGLSDDDIASLGFEKDETEAEVMPFAEFTPTMTEDEIEPEIKPLSLQELGLSDDDIALFGLEEQAAVEPLDIIPTIAEDETEPEIKPLSLKELGLSDDEIALLGLEEQAAVEPVVEPQDIAPTPIEENIEPEIKPLSLKELGLSDDEIALLGLEEQAVVEPQDIAPTPIEENIEPEIKPLSLKELGLSDDEIALLGLEEQAAVEPMVELQDVVPTIAEDETEPEIKPLSLKELGLSDDEIALLGLEEQAAVELVVESKDIVPTPIEENTEPEIKSLSLKELGLSDDDIALFGLEEQVAEPKSVAPTMVEDETEPEIKPLSLEELGLSEEEIAFINQGEKQDSQAKPSTESLTVRFDEMDMTPFSFDDLNMDDEQTLDIEKVQSEEQHEI